MPKFPRYKKLWISCNLLLLWLSIIFFPLTRQIFQPCWTQHFPSRVMRTLHISRLLTNGLNITIYTSGRTSRVVKAQHCKENRPKTKDSRFTPLPGLNKLLILCFWELWCCFKLTGMLKTMNYLKGFLVPQNSKYCSLRRNKMKNFAN